MGGVLAALILAAAGQLLDLRVAPWSWRAVSGDYVGCLAEWGWAVVVLIPLGVVLGVSVAVACALVFEYVSERAGWLEGALVGASIGLAAALTIGLSPWLASRFSYIYMPTDTPLGRHGGWSLAALVTAGLICGAIAGARYGRPLRASDARRMPRWRELYPTSRRFR
jgi:hypothetical protein